MQSFEFQADTTVSLVSPAAISRKSCDHCFLNRKTCDKVRESTDSGEKCRRCAKDNRPCTFTPTVHLYHIADCVGRHQCRAKVVQAMGGRRNNVQYKTIEIPIVCDMESLVDQALFDFIQKQPNLLVYNNRIKSFLAQDMLGVSPDFDGKHIASPTSHQTSHNYQQQQQQQPLSPTSPVHGLIRTYSAEQTTSSTSLGMNMQPNNHSAHRQRVRSEFEHSSAQHSHQQTPRAHPYALHQRGHSDDRGRHIPQPQRSPRAHPVSSHFQSSSSSSPKPSSFPSGADASALMLGLSNTAGRQSPNVNDMFNAAAAAAATIDHQRRRSDLISPTSSGPASGMNSGLAAMIQQQQQQQHPYIQQSPYPQASAFQSSQPQPIIGNTHYRASSPFPPSPVAPSPIYSNGSPHPPSPLELAIGLSANNFGGRHGSQQGLVGLFDSTLTMSTSAPQVSTLTGFHQRAQNISSSSNSTSLDSPSMASDNGSDGEDGSSSVAADVDTYAPQPMVITTTNEDGNEVAFYYAAPQVNLNPAYQDADLFQDFTMMDSVGEDFVWIQNLFEEQDQLNELASGDNVAVKKEFNASSSPMMNNAFDASSSSMMTTAILETGAMVDMMLSAEQGHHQQQQDWASQYQTSFSSGVGRSALTPQAYRDIHYPNWTVFKTARTTYKTCSSTTTEIAVPATPTMLMIEGPKFSGFDFMPPAETKDDDALQAPPSRGEPFYIRGHRVLLPTKDQKTENGEDAASDKFNGVEDTISHTSKTAGSVWDCSILLSKYLEALSERNSGFWSKKRVLELGAGQGIVSFSAAALGAERVVVTDVDSALSALRKGAQLNSFQAPQVQVTALDWTNRTDAIRHIRESLVQPTSPSTSSSTSPSFDYLLASDVIWVDFLVPFFVDTIAEWMQVPQDLRRDSLLDGDKSSNDDTSDTTTSTAHISNGKSPVLLLAYQFRSTRSDELLFGSLDRLGMKRKKVILDRFDNEDEDAVELDPKFRKSNLAIWRIWRS
ncbi:hypothetical protein BGZ83_001368 [Gryganskiella cystojenkinii]|nr:hypothetical protein BGZ83_001368 [Gryganskiella cystojenkinii]